MASKKKLKVTFKRSAFGLKPDHRACVKGLGLKRIRGSVVLQDNPCIRGMIKKVEYLLLVEEA